MRMSNVVTLTKPGFQRVRLHPDNYPDTVSGPRGLTGAGLPRERESAIRSASCRTIGIATKERKEHKGNTVICVLCVLSRPFCKSLMNPAIYPAEMAESRWTQRDAGAYRST